MTPLVKKEIRLLLPGWLAILALVVLFPWLLKDIDADQVPAIAPVVLFLGMIILAIDTFGREFSLSTFPLLMSQPVDRRQIWRAKITVLLAASVLIFTASFASCDLRLHEAFANANSIWHGNPKIVGGDFRDAMIASLSLLFVAVAGGLWTSLLLRQTAAAFWITLLLPIGLWVLIAFAFSKFKVDSSVLVEGIFCGSAGIYSLAGFWFAHRLFHRAQDVAWLGGVINFSTWRYFESGKRTIVPIRRRRPIVALLNKEFQLHNVSVICAGAVLALHIVALILRATYGNHHKNSLVYGLTTIFWIFWLLIPLLLGCTAVAEERKLGVADGQFCQPVSRRRQFVLKLIPLLMAGALLGGVMPILIEGIAAHLGAPNELFSFLARDYNNGYSTFGPGLPLASISVIGLSAAFACLGFFASTLTKNFLQALGLTVFVSIASLIMVLSKGLATVTNASLFGVTLWHSALPILIGILAVPIALLWLAWLNFSHYHEGWRLWRRNVLGLIAALAFVAVISAALYNRVWEVFEPAEPPHGPAVFSAAHRPVLSSDSGNGLQVRLPDGRIWFDCLSYPFFEYQPNIWRELWWSFVRPLPVSAGPEQFMPGSNWVSATTQRVQFWNPSGVSPRQVVGYLDTIGIKADGTLWISSQAKPVVWTGAKMIRYGNETGWRQVARLREIPLLLKNNGTLWVWGTNIFDWNHWQTNWPTVREYKPQQISSNSDWQQLFGRWPYDFVKAKDGRVWSVDWNGSLKRETNLDQVVPGTFSGTPDGPMAYIGNHGTLWANDRYYDRDQQRMMGTGRFIQAGTGTNWVAVMVNWTGMVALKSDGSLWQWRWSYNQESPLAAAKSPPTRLGIHNDWVGLTSTWGGMLPVTLAADGSLWLWPSYSDYAYEYRLFEYPPLKPPKQPEFLGNVFGKGY